jgi:nucleoside-diphosphate-sugar epimerase
MSEEQAKEWGIYGGAGFIGQHLALSVLERHPGDRVTLLDIVPPARQGWRVPLERHLAGGRLDIVQADVRDYGQMAGDAKPFDVIVNLAAVHREPGHGPEEYFETNVSGAENCCRIARESACREIIFTSSIAVYGIHDRSVDEHSRPEPKMPYGQSKLRAEGIYQKWAEETGGRLSIIRPGVVFGKGERGNVTRLVGEMLKRNRSMQIRPDQIKAGIYIEELLGIIHWLRAQTPGEAGFHLVNGVTEPPLTFNSYGQALEKTHGFGKRPFVVPESLLKGSAGLLTPLSRFFSSRSKFHPRRITKLTLVNDVRATQLLEMGYPYQWPLDDALAHWLEQGL